MIKFFKFIPVQLTLCLVLGILFGSYFVIDPKILFIIIGALVLIFALVYYYVDKKFEPSLLFTVLVFLLCFSIGISTITLKTVENKKYFNRNNLEFFENNPQTAILSISKILKPSVYNYRYEADIIQLNKQETSGKILVNVLCDSLNKPLNVDDNVLINTEIRQVSSPKNPYEFNYRNYLKNQQIYHQINLENYQFLKLGNRNSSIKGFASKVRKSINLALLKNGFSANELAVINALLLGQRQDISNDLMQSYIGAGAIHILAVSGLHVGIILIILTFLFKPLFYFKHGKTITSVCIVILLWLFAILAGLSASVVRAVTMFSAITIGLYSNRSTNVYNTLVISMFFLLLINPYYLFEVGFQLSYLAVFSIVWIQPKLYCIWQPKLWLVGKFWQLFTVSVAAQIGVLPLSLYYFHQFPGLFFVSNLVIIPFLGIILTAGVVIMLLALLDLLPQMLSEGYIFIIRQMNNFISWVSNQQVFIVENITFSFAMLITFYAFIFFMLKWTEKKNFQRMVLVLIAIVALQTVFIFEKYQIQTTYNFIVFNKTKESVFGKRLGEKLLISTSITELPINKNPMKNYLVGTGIDDCSISTSIKNLQFFKNEVILVIDSLGIYKLNSIKPDVVILRQSPKINLERMIEKMKPSIIIADGSNYKSYVSKWEKSCAKNKTPFYSTMQNGAYIFN